MIRPIRTGGAWMLLALFALHAGAAGADTSCRQQAAGALYDPEVLAPDSPHAHVVRGWLCTRTFATHADALAEGLPEGALVYGVPLASRGSFSREQVTSWKQSHCPASMKAEDVERALVAFRRLAKADALETLRECHEDEGLVCRAEVQAGFVILRASYAEFRRTAQLVELRVDGTAVEDERFPAGMPIGAEGLTYALPLGEGAREVRFELETSDGECTALAEVTTPRKHLNRNPAAPDGARRRSP